MSKHKFRTCDICEERIEHATHLRLRRFVLHGWLCRLVSWGITDYSPVDSGWRRGRVDICEPCWEELKDKLRIPQGESETENCDECGSGGGGLCPECKADAEVSKRTGAILGEQRTF